MLEQPKHKDQEELRQSLLAELDAAKQIIQELSDEELESLSGGMSTETKHTWIGAGIGAVLGSPLGPLGSSAGATLGGLIGLKIK